ncbi:Glyoxalase family protein [Alloactinosynnema sp. L-07]|uniref:VOC family protein n=1 Tax=Alloactinosynnema sp. L-07 TaxID=1653480 RepID=UPI00065F03F8|nr:VOC family protein [Alloactinosynnema sp. L-07]CRK57121.1 Glyoxalase family protein [Alloactinosynnema sp. L-07]
MTDPLHALRAPLTPVSPDPTFADDLRERLHRAILGPTGAEMTQTRTPTVIPENETAWPPTITPYIAVSDARAAIAWYIDVFGGHQRGELYVMDDGKIGHAEIGIGDAVLMVSEGGFEGVPVAAPDTTAPTTYSQSLHIQVRDVDGTVRRAVDTGARLEREPADQPYGRTATLVDPYGHRWLLNTPPMNATRHRPGDVSYVTMVVADIDKTKAFYGAVLGWTYEPGYVENGWGVEGKEDFGLWGDKSQKPEVQLCYRVTDINTALTAVRDNGGQTQEIQNKPYGQLAECTDNQGARFQLWQP